MNFKRYRDALIVLVALAVPFWFLRYSLRRNPKQPAGPDKVIVQAITPIQNAVGLLATGLSGLWTDYVYLVDVHAKNSDLTAQNARLQARVRKLESTEVENRRLRGLLELKNHVAASLISAHVLSKDTVEFFRVSHVTLDRPSEEIRDGTRLPVITLDGVVGTTGRVAGDTVEVQLVVDAGSGVDVVVERTGARGFVRGTGSESRYECKVEYVQRTDEIEVGDLLVTSGWGKRFPSGIPVARVTEVLKRDFGIYQTVVAQPTVDFSRLREVLIVLSHSGQSKKPEQP